LQFALPDCANRNLSPLCLLSRKFKIAEYMGVDSLFERLAGMGIPGVAVMLLLLAALLWFLMKGADWLVEGAAQLAYGIKIPKIIVGATVVSLGTTTPEAAVSVVSAIGGDAGLALGNAIGSVICDTGLVFGIGCLMTALPVDRFIMNRHGWLQFGFVLLLAGLIFGAHRLGATPTLTRQVGILFLALLGGYFTISVVWAKQHPLPAENVEARTVAIWRCFLMLLLGLAIVLITSKLIVSDVKQICIMLSIPQSIVSATVVAFGTSLPELVTAITSIRRGHPELLVGNILGADILNILFVIGASAAASPLIVPPEVIFLHVPAMVLIVGMFRFAASVSGTHFNRAWGIPLLGAYIAFSVCAFVFGVQAH
jgi:cation:H+ antiporter